VPGRPAVVFFKQKDTGRTARAHVKKASPPTSTQNKLSTALAIVARAESEARFDRAGPVVKTGSRTTQEPRQRASRTSSKQ